MRKLIVFNHVTLDGYFTDQHGDMSWAHAGADDAEFNEFTTENAAGGGLLIFGRITYELMASFWPTPHAMQEYPAVAEGMNRMPKLVFSRTLHEASWSNTTLVRAEPTAQVRELKQESGRDMTILGSGSIVAQLARERLIDEYHVVVNPVVLGRGRTMFEGIEEQIRLRLTRSRSFANGKVFLSYTPVLTARAADASTRHSW